MIFNKNSPKYWYCKFILIFLLLNIGCQQKKSKKDVLNGTWQGNYLNRTNVTLQISENHFIEIIEDNGNKTQKQWDFKIINDTLLLERENFKRNHIISILTKEKLELKPIKTDQVDISLIESITFKRIN